MTTDLGQIKKVSIRDVWKHEEKEFTPWLALEANISKLAEELDLGELQVEGVEVPVGPFSADILAKDASDNLVMIENQFGKTDHDHLGKVLTYAATLGAKAVIWIAERFTDEHRKAIEWLNEHTSEDLSLYAVEIELWQIDNSKPAVRFNVLSQPTVLARQATAVKSRRCHDGRPQIAIRVLDDVPKQAFRTEGAAVSTGTASATLVQHLSRSFQHAFIMHRGYVQWTNWDPGLLAQQIADAALVQLQADRKAIESEIGSELNWNPYPTKLDKVIVLDREAYLDDRSKWHEYVAWLVDEVAKFRKAFGPRVLKLTFLDEGAGDLPEGQGLTTG